MMYSIESNVLNEAVTRAGISVKDGFTLNFTERKVANTEDVYVTVTAACEASLSQTTITATPVLGATAKQVIVGTEFAGAVKALCAAGKTITIDLQDNLLNLSCGDAVIPLEYKTSTMQLQPQSPKTAENACFSMDTKELVRCFKQGGYAFAEYDAASNNAGFNYAYLLPAIQESKGAIRITSANGFCATSSYALVAQQNQKFLDMAEAVQSICLPPSVMRSICGVLKSDSITLYAFPNQLLIRDGNDLFVIVLGNKTFYTQMLTLIDNPAHAYKVTTKVSDLKVALEILSVKCSDVNRAVLTLLVDEKVVALCSAETGNRTALKATFDGSISVNLPIKQVKAILSNGATEADEVTIYGESNVVPCHITNGHCSAFVMPVAGETESNE